MCINRDIFLNTTIKLEPLYILLKAVFEVLLKIHTSRINHHLGFRVALEISKYVK